MSDAHLANNIWKEVRGHIDPYSRREVAQAIIKVLKNHSDSNVSMLCYRQLQKDATADEVEDDWAPDYDLYDYYWDDEYDYDEEGV